MRRELGSITPHKGKKGVWLVRAEMPSPDGRRRRRSKVVRGTKKQAAEALNQMLMSAGLYDGEVTFSAFLERYREWHNSVYKRPESMAKWNRDMDKLEARWGQVPLGRMRRDVMEIWASDDATSSHAVNKMKAALQKAVEWEYLDRNPLVSVKPHRAVPKKERFTAEEAASILEAVRGADIEPVVLLMLLCGMRREEALAVDWQRIDWSSGKVAVDRSWHYDKGRGWFEDTKNASSRRVVTIDPSTLARLAEVRSRGGVLRLGPVCTSSRTGKRMPPNTAGKRWREIVVPLLGERYLPMKNLRHTHASLCLEAGVAIEAIAKRLGHSSTRLTESTYAESDEIQALCADAMERVFGT